MPGRGNPHIGSSMCAAARLYTARTPPRSEKEGVARLCTILCQLQGQSAHWFQRVRAGAAAHDQTCHRVKRRDARIVHLRKLDCRGNLHMGSSVCATARLHVTRLPSAPRRQGVVLATTDGGLAAVSPLVSPLQHLYINSFVQRLNLNRHRRSSGRASCSP